MSNRGAAAGKRNTAANPLRASVNRTMLADYRFTLQETRAKLEELTEANTALEASLSHAENRLGENTRRVAELSEAARTLGAARADDAAQLAESAKRLQEAQADNRRLLLTIETLESEIAKSTPAEKLDLLMRENNLLRADADARHRELEKCRKLILDDLAGHDAAMKELEARQTTIAALRDRIVDLAGDEAFFRARADRLQTAVLALALKLGEHENNELCGADESFREEARRAARIPFREPVTP